MTGKALMDGEPIIGVLLSGGQSRRFGGGDKCLSPLAGKSMLAHAIGRLGPQVSDLIVNANGDPERFASFGLAVAPDPIGEFAGPLAGVLAGMRWAALHGGARWIVTAASDSPLFPMDLAARLQAGLGGRYPAIGIAACGGQTHPTFGLWPTSLADDLAQALETGTRRVLSWADRHDLEIVEFEALVIGDEPVDPFFNVNRKEDLEAAEGLLANSAP